MISFKVVQFCRIGHFDYLTTGCAIHLTKPAYAVSVYKWRRPSVGLFVCLPPCQEPKKLKVLLLIMFNILLASVPVPLNKKYKWKETV